MFQGPEKLFKLANLKLFILFCFAFHVETQIEALVSAFPSLLLCFVPPDQHLVLSHEALSGMLLLLSLETVSTMNWFLSLFSVSSYASPGR